VGTGDVSNLGEALGLGDGFGGEHPALQQLQAIAGGAANAPSGSGGHACALWVQASDRIAAPRGLDGERQARLSALRSGDKLTDGRSYRILTVIDQFTRECVAMEVDRSLQGKHVVAALTRAILERGQAPRSITLDNGSEFTGRALEAWAMQHGVDLCFIRLGRPVENGFIESFNGRLRDECLNVEWFGSLHLAREKLAQWREHYNFKRPHSALDDQTPATFASSYQSPAACSAPIERNTASCRPRQGFATPAKNAALDPVPRLPENAKYRGEALFEIAHSRGSLLSLWSQLHARQSSSGEP
jgi:putative transposase